MKREIVVLCSLALSAMCYSAFADGDPVVPTVKFVGCINGNLCVTLDKTINPTNALFQVKSLDFPGSDWRTVDFERKASKIPMNNVYSYYWDMDCPGETLVRVAETNAAGNSAWSEAGPVADCVRHVAAEKVPGGVYVGGNGYPNSLNDGVIGTVQESNNGGRYQQDVNVWFGLTCNSATPVGVSMIRYVPRQDTTGLSRLDGAYFQCADDESFLTNVVTIGTVATELSLGRVYECVVDPPVTSRYFRIVRYVGTDTGNYLSIDDMELVPDALPEVISMSAVNSGDWTNCWPAVTWSVPAANLCNTGVLQRALSAAGPFEDVSEWTDAIAGETFVDTNMAVGVTYYYRVKANCVSGGSFRDKIFYSDILKYVRPRRLERSWDDLTKLNAGMSVMRPLLWAGDVGAVTGNHGAIKSFDGDIATYTEASCYTNAPGEAQTVEKRVRNPAVGVDLGAKYHILGSLVYPRSDSDANLSRARSMAICGAQDEYLSGYRVLSLTLGGFPTRMWQYNSTTNSEDQFQYVFLWSPKQESTYGNVSEVGFFGYSDQDIIDSGLLIPPTTVSCETNETGVVVTWDRGWNNESYRVERRRAGVDEWTTVASLDTNVFSFVDKRVPRKGTWSWRVTAVSEGGDTISSLPCSRYYDPNVGMAIIFK